MITVTGTDQRCRFITFCWLRWRCSLGPRSSPPGPSTAGGAAGWTGSSRSSTRRPCYSTGRRSPATGAGYLGQPPEANRACIPHLELELELELTWLSIPPVPGVNTLSTVSPVILDNKVILLTDVLMVIVPALLTLCWPCVCPCCCCEGLRRQVSSSCSASSPA